jgi:hypothetical protein
MAKSRKRRDPMDGMLEDALEPGRFIGWNEGFAFVSDLSDVERKIARLVASEPASSRAVRKPSFKQASPSPQIVLDRVAAVSERAGNPASVLFSDPSGGARSRL